MTDDFFSLMMSFVREAGAIALSRIDDGRSELKADTSVITEADRRISALAHARLEPCLKTGKHLLIDEEDPRRGDYLDDAVLGRTPFVWAVDPIDGTRAYANRMPHYGISIGLIKDQRPWLGAVYFPSLKELFYCDGDAAYFVQNAFSSDEKKTPIVPVDELITSRSVFICADDILKGLEWRSTDCHAMVFATAVCELCWPSIGRGCGALVRLHFWDMAGSWPIFERAGLKMMSLRTGRPLDRLEASAFEKSPSSWRLKDLHILSSPQNFEALRARLVFRSEERP